MGFVPGWISSRDDKIFVFRACLHESFRGMTFVPRWIHTPYSTGLQIIRGDILRNISTTSVSISSEVPNTEKLMRTRGRRPSVFIVSRCLEPLMKHEARVVDITSQQKALNKEHWIELMNIFCLHESVKSQYRQAAIVLQITQCTVLACRAWQTISLTSSPRSGHIRPVGLYGSSF